MLWPLLIISLLYLFELEVVDTQVKTTTPFPYNNYTAHCPPFTVTNPCNCTLFHGIDSEIRCDNGNIKFNLTTTLQTISDYLAETHEPEKHFTSFELRNTAITELEDRAFRGISFDEIYIENATSLKRISSSAFEGSEKRTVKFYQEGSNMMADTDYPQFFSALNSLTNAKTITFLNHNIRLIPNRAFANNTMIKCERLVFNFDGISNRGTLTSIGNYAFYGLKAMTYLNLGQQLITHVSSNAFEFADASNETLKIYLNDNQLNGSSFDLAVFTNTLRPIWLNLDNNKIDYLEEKVFRPLFVADKRNKVSLNGHNLNCSDCRNVWLVKEKATLSAQTENMFCSERSNDTIWQFNNFNGC